MAQHLNQLFLDLPLYVIGKIPFWAIRILSTVLAAVAFLLPSTLNSKLKTNWQIAFRRPPKALEKFRVWWYFFNNILSIVKIARLSPEEFRCRIHLKIHPDVAQLLQSKKPIIATTAHLGCWEVLPRIQHCVGQGKYAAVYQPLRNRQLNAWMLQTRSQDGVRLIDRNNVWQQSIQAIREGYTLAILADQNSGRHGVWTPLFGVLASTSPLPALLSYRTKTPMVPVFVLSLPKSQWEVQALAPMVAHNTQIAKTMAYFNSLLEQRIRAHPWDWLWFHDRWKLPNPQWLLASWAYKIHIPENSFVQPLRVVIRGMNWLGDAVMHLRAIRDIKASRPDIHLTVATISSLAGLYRRCPFVDEVLIIPGKKSLMKTVSLLRKGHYQVAVLLPNSPRVIFEARLAGIPHRAGYRVGQRTSRDITIKVPLEKLPKPNEHQAVTWQRAVNYWGGRSDDSPVRLLTSQYPPRPTPYGILAPGAAYGPAKRWPVEHFAKCAQLLSEKVFKWLIVGAACDVETCAKLAELLPGAENLAGKTTLEELIDLLAHACVVISNDSGIMHLAATCSAPTVAIFGSTSPEATRPVGQCEIVQHKTPCSPCFERTCRYGHYECLTGIQPATVSEAAIRAMQYKTARSQ